jgi:hypothetical protein
MTRVPVAVVPIAAVALLTGCQVQKSANPLSPTIAGPIPGVNITAPQPVAPASGTKVAVDQQPITLVVQNASTNGVRPLSYLFEVAADSDFQNKVFSREGIKPGDGQTSFKLPDPLATGRTYYWRARAQDGANTGPYSSGTAFNVFTPIVIQAPTPTAPIGNVVTSSATPHFEWTNAVRSGPVGAIAYQVEVASSDTFANKIATWTVAETPSQTGLDSPQALAYGTQYFWHVRAFDPTTAGPWSSTQAFSTPVTPSVTQPPPGGGGGTSGGCGASSADQIDMSTARIYDSPPDLSRWCVTASITSVQFTPSAFLVDFDRRTGANRWPDSPFGDGSAGTIQYTLGMCLNINGHWDCSAVVQFWYGRDLSGSGPPSQVGINWFYNARWGEMQGHQPANGETVGLFVCAGNCRSPYWSSVVHERSNVVLVRWQN